MTKMNLLDRVVMEFSPQKACNRMYYKEVCRGYYDSADTGRLKDGWTTSNAPGNVIDRGDRDIIRARARALERNDDMFKSIILDLERNIVGTGIIMQAKVMKSDAADAEEDEDANRAIERAWKKWCKPSSCTVTGTMNFAGVQRQIVRRRFVDGGLLILKVYRKGQFCLQLLEVDCLDSTMQRANNNRVVGGIEIDEFNRPVAYHIKIVDVTGMYQSKTVRLSADQVIYLPDITRPSQVREFSPSASSLGKVDDVNQLIAAALTKEEVQACFGAAITRQNGGGLGGIGRGAAPTSTLGVKRTSPYSENYLVPGMILNLEPGESVSSISPSGMSSTADGIIRTIQRQAGSGAGLSYEAVSRDMSQVNYSSARQGMLQDRKTYSVWQQYIVDHFLEPVFEEWLYWAVTTGLLTLPGYFKNPERYTVVKWLPAGWDWIDPLKEANANRVALDSGQTTLQKICAGRGEDYHDIILQRSKEIREFQELLPNMYPQEPPDPTGKETSQEPTDTKRAKEPEPVSAPKKETSDQPDTTLLNGAQITSLVSIVTSVASGQLSFESALAILTSCLGIEDSEARKILNNGKKMEPAEVTPGKEDDEDGATPEEPDQL